MKIRFDFISSVVSGVTANGVTRLVEALWGGDKAYNLEDKDPENDINKNEVVAESKKLRLFQNFHIKSGFETILNSVDQPIVHFVIEDKPTTAWHLVTIVVESQVTGQWYVSQRGEMAFEGSGGGLFL
ncbi:hypothetical protein [Pseudoalteromonas maricaloris]|uniref:hypothetical protein n=1 Tax=Pseudoalteromonas maricaloris TaxID=184924 RepID=UPI003C28DA81